MRAIRWQRMGEREEIAMKCKKLKRLACLLLALGMLTAEAVTIGAAELPEVQPVNQADASDSGEADGDNFVIGTVQMPLTRASGEVLGDQVRLRKGPDSTAAVLELMKFGERVVVDMERSSVIPGGQWLYVKRMLTGTWGWVVRDYIGVY